MEGGGEKTLRMNAMKSTSSTFPSVTFDSRLSTDDEMQRGLAWMLLIWGILRPLARELTQLITAMWKKIMGCH